MAWSDLDGGHIAAMFGSSQREQPIQWLIDRDARVAGNPYGYRPVRVTVHLGSSQAVRP
jgi:hypothetical protein